MKFLTTLLFVFFALTAFSQDVIKLSAGHTLNRNIIYIDNDIIITENFKGVRDTLQRSEVNRYNIKDKEKAKYFNESIVPSIYYKAGTSDFYQSPSNTLPGDYLLKAKSRMAGGIGLTLVSSVIMGLSPVITDDETTQYVILGVGGAFGIGGLGVFISGIVQIGKAGELMNDLRIGKTATLDIGIQENGVGLKVKL